MSDLDEDHGPGPGELSEDQAACEHPVVSQGWCRSCDLMVDMLSPICRACAGGNHHMHSRFSGGMCLGCACPVLLPYGFEPSIGADL